MTQATSTVADLLLLPSPDDTFAPRFVAELGAYEHAIAPAEFPPSLPPFAPIASNDHPLLLISYNSALEPFVDVKVEPVGQSYEQLLRYLQAVDKIVPDEPEEVLVLFYSVQQYLIISLFCITSCAVPLR